MFLFHLFFIIDRTLDHIPKLCLLKTSFMRRDDNCVSRDGCSINGSVMYWCLVSLHLQLDSPFHLWHPAVISGITATTSSGSIATTALSSNLGNGIGEHGPLRFHGPHYFQYVAEALLVVGVEDNFQRFLRRTFLADPEHYSGQNQAIYSSHSQHSTSRSHIPCEC